MVSGHLALEWEWAKSLQGIRKSPGAFVGTFRKILFITSSRRLKIKLMGYYDSDGNNYQENTLTRKNSQGGKLLGKLPQLGKPRLLICD